MKRFLSFLAWSAWIVANPMAGRAATINHIYSLDVTSPPGIDLIGVQPFDPVLGTLDAVNVSINGILTVTGPSTPQVDPQIGPIPYSYNFTVGQSFFGLAGKYFNFLTPAQFQFSGGVSGAGESVFLAQPFDLSFYFNATSDLLGTGAFLGSFSGLVPPSSIAGSRTNFLNIIPIDEIDLVQTASFLSDMGLQAMTAHAGGTLSISYDYTPAPAPVPEPGTLVLLGSGLMGMVAYGKNRFRK